MSQREGAKAFMPLWQVNFNFIAIRLRFEWKVMEGRYWQGAAIKPLRNGMWQVEYGKWQVALALSHGRLISHISPKSNKSIENSTIQMSTAKILNGPRIFMFSEEISNKCQIEFGE